MQWIHTTKVKVTKIDCLASEVSDYLTLLNKLLRSLKYKGNFLLEL